jgi:DNA-binding MarR family transcriptional regulator
MSNITPRQRDAILAVRTLARQLKRPPTLTELAEHLHITPGAAWHHIDRLKILGYLRHSNPLECTKNAPTR